MTDKNGNTIKKVLAAILYIVIGMAVFAVSLVGFSANWVFHRWGDLDMDEIIFQLQMPLEGTGDGMIGEFILSAVLPTVLILAVYIIGLILLKKGKRRLICSLAFLAAAVIAGFFVKDRIWQRLDMESWIADRKNQSDFISKEYVDPARTEISFPEEKRNLIYIYVESMETTYANKASGGAFSENVIPELTEIAMENEDFSGSDEKLNGGLVFSGTGFTSGAIFAQSAGLPLKLSIGNNNMDTQESFFPQVCALGDILEEQGYRQVYLLGSDASFGGRRLYYRDHGNFEIRDYVYAKEQGWIAPDYFVWWGYEDQKLFSFAKETLDELSEGEEPFNLTILTVDTHFEDGYVCDLCEEPFGDDQYSNVHACASRQLDQFLSWLQKQDYYEDTTVILSGDHTTMDTDYCDNIAEDYSRRTYTAVINGAAVLEDPERRREFCTFDLFPTTLAAMGASIKGDRLGLGTNLYSSQNTLVETYGEAAMRKELRRRSAFLEELEKVETDADALYDRFREYLKYALVIEEYDGENGILKIRVNENAMTGMSVDHVEVCWQEMGSDLIDKKDLIEDPEHPYSHIGEIDISTWSEPAGTIWVNYYTTNDLVYEKITVSEIDYRSP